MKIETNCKISKPYCPKMSFKHSYTEHVSWGANYIKKNQKANFKLFTFPDTKAVFVEIAKQASTSVGNIKDRIVQLLFTQGAAMGLKSVMPSDDTTEIYPMKKNGNGVFTLNNVPCEKNNPYRFIIQKDETDIRLVKDPYAKKQPNINGWSLIYDQTDYDWQNNSWINGEDKRKITRKPNEKMRGLENLIIEEVNIPTLSIEGSFDKAKEHINHIAEKGIATAVEIMPAENTFSLQWGYDGVDKFAVNEKLGGANKFKELIDYIHGKGLNVIIDMVPNHMGPDGYYINDEAGPYIKGQNDFGLSINYEGANNKYVRDWMVNAALWWLNEFKADGLRLDMTKFCDSDYLLKQIVAEVNYHNPKAFIIAEDGRDNLKSVTEYASHKFSHKKIISMIDKSVENITKGWLTYPNEIGFDSEWDFPFMHELKNTILMPASINLDRLDDRIRNSKYRVKFVMSHDEIGNIDGTRLIPKVIASQLNIFKKMQGSSDTERRQKAAHLSQEFTKLYVTGTLKNMSDEEIHKIAIEHGMNPNARISFEEIELAFNIARAKQKLAMGTVMSVPGPKMYFQGDDELKLSYFKFFREFSDDKEKRAKYPEYVASIIAEKGYDTLEEIARPESVLGSIVPEDNTYSTQMRNFMKDLSTIVKKSKALTLGDIVDTRKDTYNNIHSHLLKQGDEEIIVLKNFGDKFHTKSYKPPILQSGEWEEIFNSDSVEYGGSGYINKGVISTENNDLNIAPNSICILRKINQA